MLGHILGKRDAFAPARLVMGLEMGPLVGIAQQKIISGPFDILVKIGFVLLHLDAAGAQYVKALENLGLICPLILFIKLGILYLGFGFAIDLNGIRGGLGVFQI